MRRFQISLVQPAFDALQEMARDQRRPLKDQAAWILERQLLPAEASREPGRSADAEQAHARTA